MENKKVSTKLLLKTSFWYTISNFLAHAMVFITMPIFTRLMTKAEYGDFSVYANWQTILVIICGFEVNATLNRARFDFQEKEELNGYITSCLFLTTLITGIVFVLYLLFPGLFDRWFLLDRKYIYIMFAYLFTFPAYSMFIIKQRVEYKYKLSAAISFTITIASSLIALVLVSINRSDRLFGRIFGQYILSILLGFSLYMYFLYNSRSIKKQYCLYALRMGLPLVFTYLASRILLTSDTIVLKHMCTAEEVSYLSVSHSASQIILLLVQALNIAWSPWYYDMLKLKEYEQIGKVYRIYLWAALAITFCAVLIGPELIHVLGSGKYRESIHLFTPYILSGVFTVLTSQFGYLETYNKKPEYAAILTAIVAILNITLDIIGVKLIGYRAVCYATVLCQIILILLHYRVTNKMEISKILSMKTLMAVLITSVMFIPVSSLLYANTIVRYGFIACTVIIIASIAVIKRAQIKAIIKNIRKPQSGNYHSKEE